MNAIRFLLSLCLIGAMASTASAMGAVDITWDTCTGPINKEITPGSQAKLHASVLGHDQPHLAYQVWLRFRTYVAPLRDAWRFDAAGCQGSSRISIDHLNTSEMSKTCPIFQGALVSYQLKEYRWDPLTGSATTYVANTYPAGNTTQVNAAQRYFLASWLFDHTFSVEGTATPGAGCGGLEVPVCGFITKTSWLTLDGVEHPWWVSISHVRSRDPANTGCPGAVPAENRTWGALKAQYKR